MSRFPFEVPGQDPDRHMYQAMAVMTRHAGEVCFENGTVDPSIFPPIPHSTAEGDYEAGRIIPERNNLTYAFSAALYARRYGAASEPGSLVVKSGESVGKTLGKWDAVLAKNYEKVVTKQEFERIFFEGGLAKVFLDPAIPEIDAVRQLLDLPGQGGLSADPDMRRLAGQTREAHFVRQSYPHVVSHMDAARFVNTVLNIGYREMGVREPAAALELMRSNLPELKRVAMISVPEMDVVSSKMVDPRDDRLFRREFFTTDPDTQTVGFDDEAVAGLIAANAPQAGQLKRRGCPVLFQKTEFGGAEVPVFQAMNDTLVRIYKETGALERLTLRRITK